MRTNRILCRVGSGPRRTRRQGRILNPETSIAPSPLTRIILSPVRHTEAHLGDVMAATCIEFIRHTSSLWLSQTSSVKPRSGIRAPTPVLGPPELVTASMVEFVRHGCNSTSAIRLLSIANPAESQPPPRLMHQSADGTHSLQSNRMTARSGFQERQPRVDFGGRIVFTFWWDGFLPEA